MSKQTDYTYQSKYGYAPKSQSQSQSQAQALSLFHDECFPKHKSNEAAYERCISEHQVQVQVGGKKKKKRRSISPVRVNSNKAGLAKLSVDQLQKLAKRANIRGRSTFTKAKLVNALSKLQ